MSNAALLLGTQVKVLMLADGRYLLISETNRIKVIQQAALTTSEPAEKVVASLRELANTIETAADELRRAPLPAGILRQ